MTDDRLPGLKNWLSSMLQIPSPALEQVSGDASFRRYFRFAVDSCSLVGVDSPPQTEKNRQFIEVAGWLAGQGIRVPAIHHADLEQGWLCLEDLGARLLLDELDPDNAAGCYREAMALLLKMQAAPRPAWLASYDRELIQRENLIFVEWFLERHLQLTLTAAERALWRQVTERLSDNHLSQPQVVMHRDFHSRNLMRTAGQLALIDFQDTVLGPVAYDLVSLLRDCYIAWPQALVDELRDEYLQLARQRGIVPAGVGADEFRRWFDWSGLQRHLKAIGIFARLSHRDGKPDYLKDIPRTLDYVIEVTGRYPEWQAFADWLKRRVLSCQEARI